MTKVSLSFSLARESSYNEAVFDSIEEKNKYVSAEYTDLKIRDLYKQYSATLNKALRTELAKKLDSARYQFYQAWLKNNKKVRPIKSFPKVPPDIA